MELKASDKGLWSSNRTWGLREGPLDRLHLPLSLDHCEVQPLAWDDRAPERTGFLASVHSSLLNLRIETKRLKKTNKDYVGIDSVLKWMLVKCLGYTGYRNAKFGQIQIQIHERITETSRELLMQIKEMAREHWLRGPARHRGLPVGCWRAYSGIRGGLKWTA